MKHFLCSGKCSAYGRYHLFVFRREECDWTLVMEGISEDVYTEHVQGTDDTDSEDDILSGGGNNTERKKRKLNNIDVLDRRSVDVHPLKVERSHHYCSFF